MFGMDLGEILVIAIVAILFLGPDKLPGAMVEIAKFLKNTKNTIGSIKDSFEEELNVKSMKDEALAYKKELLDVGNEVKSAADIKTMAAKLTTLEDDFFVGGSLEPEKKAASAQPQEVTFKKSDTVQATNKIEEDKKNV